MKLEEKISLLVRAARLLYVHAHPTDDLVVVVSRLGAALRRMISHYSSDAFLRQFAAAVLAGLVGIVAIHFRLSATLSLVAMAPCMILVPGVHFLNSLMDMYSARMELGGCQLLFAAIIMVAISTGLLLSLGMGGASLPVTEAGRAIPLMLDAPAARIAAASFATFFSMPRKLLGWTVALAVVAHVLRWVLMAFAGLSFAWAALAACAVAGAVATPIAHRLQAPFAGVGFAAVVSMIPGIFIFRTAIGLIHILDQRASASSALVAATLSDAIMAAVVVLAMGIGLVTSLVYPRIVYTDLNRLFCKVLEVAHIQSWRWWEHVNRLLTMKITLEREGHCRSGQYDPDVTGHTMPWAENTSTERICR